MTSFASYNHDLVRNGQMLMGLSTTPLAVPVTSTTAPKFILWNPAGSGKNLVLVRYTAGWTGTTEAPGNILLSWTAATGSAVATGAAISAFTDGVKTNALLGGGATTGIARFGIAATLGAAGTAFYGMGLNHLTTTGAAITQTGWMYEHIFYDTIHIAPGNSVHTVASTATATLYNETILWYEEAV